MKKSMLALLMVSLFTVAAAGTSFAKGDKAECTVDGVNADKVMVTCEQASTLKAGEKALVVINKSDKVKCTVDAVAGDKVTMTCDKEKASTLKAGEKAMIVTKKAKAVEGC